MTFWRLSSEVARPVEFSPVAFDMSMKILDMPVSARTFLFSVILAMFETRSADWLVLAP